MKNDLYKAYLQATAKADNLAMSIMHHLNVIEAFRDRKADTWADVGTLNSIIEKLEKADEEIRAYCDCRVPDYD